EMRGNGVELPPRHQTLTKVAPERAVDLGIEMGRHSKPLVHDEGGGRPASPRSGEHLDGDRRVERDQSSEPSSWRPSRTRSAPVLPRRSIGGDFPTAVTHSATVGRDRSSARISMTY